ncbi:MAG: hypothetical protein D6808_02285 [Candidatus Dadabacteria bacterium]|nr:MAG: hypothetical protein D6808_02285 [Candidatus Dadabacteria bacterium]
MDKTDDKMALAASPKEDMKGRLWTHVAAFLSMKSTNTRKTYIPILKEWNMFISGEEMGLWAEKAFLNATEIDAIKYINWLRSRPGQSPRLKSSESDKEMPAIVGERPLSRDGTQYTLTNSTIRKKIAALRRIYRVAISAGLYNKPNPFASESVKLPSAQSGQKRPTEMVDFNMVSKIISLPDEDTPKGLRDKAILAVLFGGGLRRSEAAALRIGDVRKTAKGTVYLVLRSTKSGKDANQALPPWAAKIVLRQVSERLQRGAKSGDYLFVSFRGKGGSVETKAPISHSGIYKLFKRYCHAAGIKNFVSPHSARATSITKLLDEGLSHREVLEFSRHSSIQMVEIYDKRRYSVDESPAKKLDF